MEVAGLSHLIRIILFEHLSLQSTRATTNTVTSYNDSATAPIADMTILVKVTN